MAEEPRLNDDLESFAAALSGFSLQPARLNRDQLMYEAGRASALATPSAHQTSLRVWKTATALSTVTAACLVALLIPHQEIRPTVAVPTLPVSKQATDIVIKPPVIESQLAAIPPQPSGPSGPGTEMSYIAQRNLALAGGLDKLPPSRTSTGEQTAPATYRELLESLSNSRDFGS